MQKYVTRVTAEILAQVTRSPCQKQNVFKIISISQVAQRVKFRHAYFLENDPGNYNLCIQIDL